MDARILNQGNPGERKGGGLEGEGRMRGSGEEGGREGWIVEIVDGKKRDYCCCKHTFYH